MWAARTKRRARLPLCRALHAAAAAGCFCIRAHTTGGLACEETLPLFRGAAFSNRPVEVARRREQGSFLQQTRILARRMLLFTIAGTYWHAAGHLHCSSFLRLLELVFLGRARVLNSYSVQLAFKRGG